jgi:hypothetical protein
MNKVSGKRVPDKSCAWCREVGGKVVPDPFRLKFRGKVAPIRLHVPCSDALSALL